jgi:hypothetical protein
MSLIHEPKFLLNVSLDVSSEVEARLNEVYDQEHVPALLNVPGVVSIQRYRRQHLKLALGGSIRDLVFEAEPMYSTLYEVESPEVLVSAAWAEAVEMGSWPAEIRPFTRNRRHTLHKLINGQRNPAPK